MLNIVAKQYLLLRVKIYITYSFEALAKPQTFAVGRGYPRTVRPTNTGIL